MFVARDKIGLSEVSNHRHIGWFFDVWNYLYFKGDVLREGMIMKRCYLHGTIVVNYEGKECPFCKNARAKLDRYVKQIKKGGVSIQSITMGDEINE